MNPTHLRAFVFVLITALTLACQSVNLFSAAPPATEAPIILAQVEPSATTALTATTALASPTVAAPLAAPTSAPSATANRASAASPTRASASPTTRPPGALAPTSVAMASATPTTRASTTLAPSATATPTSRCPAITPQTKTSGWVKSVTLARSVNADTYDPVNPTTEFARAATIHAVVATQNAPAYTKIKAAWYASDVSAVACNTFIDQAELSEIEGTRNIDFTLGGNNPVGAYRVEISVNGTLERVVTFTVK
ncbi:MAG: hypothetical protein HY868_14380 [Chloroflexi bacterium]|nr:hypothetical protein [Chloroflexota bacterium]